MSSAETELTQAPASGAPGDNQGGAYSLNDDRRVRTLSPGALIAKRFFRNRLAVVGLVMLLAMFVFSFIGGVVSPYGQDEQFYTYKGIDSTFAAVSENQSLRYTMADGQEFGSILQAKVAAAIKANQTSVSRDGKTYDIANPGEGVYLITQAGKTVAVASAQVVSAADGQPAPTFDFTVAALTAKAQNATSFTADGVTYDLDDTGNITQAGADAGYVSQFIVSASDSSKTVTRELRDLVLDAIENDQDSVDYTKSDGSKVTFKISYEAYSKVYTVTENTETYVYDAYASPSFAHPLGTDKNGMDMLTRLMYGGRISLMIGFIVVFIAGGLGILLGGISGYFGGWIDNLIMRVVDVFYCIPSMPIIIILGSIMDSMQLPSLTRMIYLMIVLGILSWAPVARLVRGQILSLREQEFMVATEACGISVPHRIFRHLIPNVMPQLIVSCTMMLGSTIITEATLSFLGLGVKFPFASWGNIINDVNNAYVMTNYWFIWIPAGICLLITVLGFNFVGDGLRDAFDPKMNR